MEPALAKAVAPSPAPPLLRSSIEVILTHAAERSQNPVPVSRRTSQVTENPIQKGGQGVYAQKPGTKTNENI